jgi:hypothetical protein
MTPAEKRKRRKAAGKLVAINAAVLVPFGLFLWMFSKGVGGP